ncbi:GPI-linked NAD(P)(+)--arginine ADP-ribosyltransferase 1-like [Garra rufa]|uniref:GPI-linked NAD(P)(+)--arginine ADP-ribosyltransferase 1-like n=1 Tax=Garra rufa TaxID=137080 RepID=UPI003CCEEB62
MLLIIEALLLISAALGQDHRAAVVEKIFPLDMALKSVDDLYMDCKKKMANLVETKYLKQEMSNPESNFAIAWKLAEKKYKPPEDNLTENHSIAIYVYTDSGLGLYKEFNEADRKDKKRYKNKTYKWYSLHFLLTEAIQILKKTQKNCYSTYRGTNIKFKQNVVRKNIRFGSFTSSSINRDKTHFFGNVSCFEIHTCEGAEVSKYSKLPREKEVLIPPYEKFKVTAVKKKIDQKDLWCETVFTLKSSGKRSDLNCALFKKQPTP